MRNYTLLHTKKGVKVLDRNVGHDSTIVEDLLKMNIAKTDDIHVQENAVKPNEFPTAADSNSVIPKDIGTKPQAPALVTNVNGSTIRPRRKSGARPPPARGNLVISTRRASLSESVSSCDALSLATTSSNEGTSTEGATGSTTHVGETTPHQRIPQLAPMNFSGNGLSFFDDDQDQASLLTPHLHVSDKHVAKVDESVGPESNHGDIRENANSSNGSVAQSLSGTQDPFDQYHQQIRRASEAAQALAVKDNRPPDATSITNGKSPVGADMTTRQGTCGEPEAAPSALRLGWQTFTNLSPSPAVAGPSNINGKGYFDQLTLDDDTLHESESSGSSPTRPTDRLPFELADLSRAGWQSYETGHPDITTPRGMPNHPMLQQIAQAKMGSVPRVTKSKSPTIETSPPTASHTIRHFEAGSPVSQLVSPQPRIGDAPIRPSFASRKSRSMLDLREGTLGISVDHEKANKAVASLHEETAKVLSPVRSPKIVTTSSPLNSTASRRLSLPSLHQTCPSYYEADYYTTEVNRSSGRTQKIHARPDEGTETLPPYSCDIHMEGWAQRKMEFTKPGQPAQQRPWKRIYVYLHGPSLKIMKTDPRISAPPGDVHPYREFRPDVFKTSVPAQNISIPRSAETDGHSGRGHGSNGQAGQNGDRDKETLAGAISHIPLVSSLSKAGSNICLRHYSLHNAESGLAADYHKRKHVVRVRAEGEQFLLQLYDDRSVVEWIEALQGGTNISKDLDAREQPKFITLPRRRRRRAAGTSSITAAAASGAPTGRTHVTRTSVSRRNENDARPTQNGSHHGAEREDAASNQNDSPASSSNLNRVNDMLAEEQDEILGGTRT